MKQFFIILLLQRNSAPYLVQYYAKKKNQNWAFVFIFCVQRLVYGAARTWRALCAYVSDCNALIYLIILASLLLSIHISEWLLNLFLIGYVFF